MKADLSLGGFAVLAIFLCTGVAQAYPVSSCTAGADGDHFSCNLYPTDSSGNLATDSGIITAPSLTAAVGAGYLVFLNVGYDPTVPANDQAMGLWDEVIWVKGDSGLDTFTGEYQTSHEFEVFTGADMPSYTTVENYNSHDSGIGGAVTFLAQNADGIYVYTPANHVYTIYDSAAVNVSEQATGVPEPGVAGLMLLGLSVLYVKRARLVRRRATPRMVGLP